MRLPIVKNVTLMLVFSTLLCGCSTLEIPLDGAMSDAVTSVEVTTIGVSQTTTEPTTLATTIATEETSQGLSDTTPPDTTTLVSETEATTTTPIEDELFGYTLEEVTQVAKELYQKACDTYRSMLIEGAYNIDFNSAVTDQYGKRYYRVDDPSCTNTEEALEAWHQVFTNAYDDLMSTTYVMYDGGLYAYVGIQQENTNYDSTTLAYYYPTGDYELTFKATSHYSSGDKVFRFAITYLPDTQEWRVSKFTMPY